MGRFGEPDEKRKELSLKRQALQVAGMLPDDPQEALAVLNYARGIIAATFGIDDVQNKGENTNCSGQLKLVTQRPLKTGRADGAG